MKVRRIAAFLLVVYVAICISFLLHIHLTERSGEHCSICQVLDAPGDPLTSAAHDPLLTLQESCVPVVQIAACSELASIESERAPPSI